MLYLVATPVGNLSDLTFRAVEVLRSCDYILCEDTRHSSHLLKAYDISRPLVSYHKFSEAKKLSEIIDDLKSNFTIALISDAGTPTIADPGHRLVKECIAQNIQVSAVPGACAAIIALTLSGFDISRFQFLGFLPRKKGDLRRTLIDALAYPGVTVCYESPHRITKVLQAIEGLAPQTRLCVARELTKKFEETLRGTATEILTLWQEHAPKGEIILAVEGNPSAASQWSDLSPQDHVTMIENLYDVPRREAIKIVAEIRGIPKRSLYH